MLYTPEKMRRGLQMGNAKFCIAVSILLLSGCSSIAQSAPKKKVTSQSDLPRFSYPISIPASQLVQSDTATFDAFASKVRTDLDSVFRDYEISDKATMRALLSSKLDLQQLAGEYSAAIETVKTMRALEEKPSARLTTGLFV